MHAQLNLHNIREARISPRHLGRDGQTVWRTITLTDDKGEQADVCLFAPRWMTDVTITGEHLGATLDQMRAENEAQAATIRNLRADLAQMRVFLGEVVERENTSTVTWDMERN
jgi:hypothetical protein